MTEVPQRIRQFTVAKRMVARTGHPHICIIDGQWAVTVPPSNGMADDVERVRDAADFARILRDRL